MMMMQLTVFPGCYPLPSKSEVLIACLLVDPGTIAKGAALLHQEGAREVYACCTHAVFRYWHEHWCMSCFTPYSIYEQWRFVKLCYLKS